MTSFILCLLFQGSDQEHVGSRTRLEECTSRASKMPSGLLRSGPSRGSTPLPELLRSSPLWPGSRDAGCQRLASSRLPDRIRPLTDAARNREAQPPTLQASHDCALAQAVTCMGRHAHTPSSRHLYSPACACLNFQPNIHAERLKHDEPEVSKPAHAEFFLLHRPAFVQCLFAAASNSEHEREGGPA